MFIELPAALTTLSYLPLPIFVHEETTENPDIIGFAPVP